MIAALDVERARRADRLLEELLELRESEREARIRALRSEDVQLAALVDRLLRAAEAEEEGEDPKGLAGTSDAPDLSERAIGTLVGAWRIEKALGRGGMSRVFVAERVQGGFRQRAALKLFERSPELAGGLVQRFEQERQILATLDHPNIARVLDGGVAADGRPYLVLELIEGETLDRWCELRDPPLARRLEVFVAAARAVQHAHRHLIVHRDLKPSNLLVTPQGVVKLLDFGIAKVLAGSEALAGSAVLRATTLTASRPLTPAYASPEQVRGEPIQTSSDIYQLGLLLYELLAGRPAHLFREDSWRELERVVCESDPEPLVERRLKAKSAESRTRSVPPELETVVRKALQKDPARRYGSADHLADDVVRFLNDEPVLARPDTLTYRARKFVRRHRIATAATACILLSLAAGGWATAWQAREAARQRDAARLAAEKSQSALELLLDVFQIADEGGGGAVTARELVERSVARVQSEPTSDRLRADRLEVLARADEGLGLTAAAAKLRAEIVAITRREDGSESLQLARELDRLGSTLVLAGDYQEAISRLEEALRLQSTALGEENPDTLTTSSHLSYALGVKGDVRRSLALRERVLAARRRIHGESSAEVAQASNDVGRSLRFLGRTEEAEQHLRRAIDLRRGLDGATAPSVSVPLSNLGHALLDRGAFAEAEAVATEALELSQRAVRAGHPSLAGRFHLMGSVRLAERRLREAEEYFRQALELYRSVLPPTHFSIAETELSLAEALWLDERPRDAEALARAADERLRRSFSEGGFRVGQADALLGACWAANGGGSAAIRLAEAGYGAIVRELGEASPVAARARFHLDAARRASKGQGSSPASGS